MIYHYCRVSSADQNLSRQIDALSEYKPADRVFSDKASGKNFERDGYQQLKAVIRSGDELIIKELDRLGRNKEDMKAELKWFKDNGVTVRVLDVPTTLMDFRDQKWIQDMINNILIEVLGAVAEQERNKIKRRQAEGIKAKKDRGEWDDYGRPAKAIDGTRFAELIKKQRDGVVTVDECCRELNISRSTWYSRLRETA